MVIFEIINRATSIWHNKSSLEKSIIFGSSIKPKKNGLVDFAFTKSFVIDKKSTKHLAPGPDYMVIA